MQESKKPWQSKVAVLNAVLGLAAFLALFVPGAQEFAQNNVAPHLIEGGVVWSVLNVVLRLFKSNIEFK